MLLPKLMCSQGQLLGLVNHNDKSHWIMRQVVSCEKIEHRIEKTAMAKKQSFGIQ